MTSFPGKVKKQNVVIEQVQAIEDDDCPTSMRRTNSGSLLLKQKAVVERTQLNLTKS